MGQDARHSRQSGLTRWPGPQPIRNGEHDNTRTHPQQPRLAREVRKFEAGSGQLELVNLDAGPVGRATFQPGWRWSQHVKPIANPDSCQAAHTGYFISGRMKVVMDDGEEME